jgi:hypothetical protein
MNGNDRHNDLNVTWTAIAGFVGAILIFAFIVAAQIVFQRAEQTQYLRKVVAEAPEQLGNLRAEQLARINSYRLVDEKRAIAAIPIDQAMEAFVHDQAGSMRAIQAAEQAGPAGASATQGGAATQGGVGTQVGRP